MAMEGEMYAIVDAPGEFDSAGRGASYVFEAHSDLDYAIRRAKFLEGCQVIECPFPKGDVVYEDMIDREFPSVWRQGDG